MEFTVSVDEPTTGSVGILTILLTLLLHTNDTLREGITGTVCTRIGLSFKAVQVCLHHINALAHGHPVLVDLVAQLVVGINEVDTRDTPALLALQVHVELE